MYFGIGVIFASIVFLLWLVSPFTSSLSKALVEITGKNNFVGSINTTIAKLGDLENVSFGDYVALGFLYIMYVLLGALLFIVVCGVWIIIVPALLMALLFKLKSNKNRKNESTWK